MMPMQTRCATLLLLLTAAYPAAAQDQIHFRDGTTAKVRVQTIAPATIRYTSWDNPEAPSITVRREDVTSIRYANGTEESMTVEGAKHKNQAPLQVGRGQATYGRNTLSLAPVQMANEGPMGIGLHYERVIDRRYRWSVVLPVACIIYNQFGSSSTASSTFGYVYPGVKFYPAGSNRRFAYALGAALALGAGKRTVNDDGYWGEYPDSKRLTMFKAGLMATNSLNIQPTPHLYLGVELGLGLAIYDRENDYRHYRNVPGEPMVNFNFRIGYRF